MDAEVGVVGLGLMGTMSAWRIARRGVSVLGFEQFEPGHLRGSSHGRSRIIRTAYYEGPEYVPLLLEAFPLWRELEAMTGEDLLVMTGALMIGPPDGALIGGVSRSIAEYGLEHERLDAGQVQARYPMHRLRSGDIAIYEAAAGVLRPEACLAAGRRRARDLGLTEITGTAVVELRPGAGGVEIVTADGRAHHVRHALVTAGAWTGRLIPGLAHALTIERQVQVWWPAEDPGLYHPSRCPVYMVDSGGPVTLYGFPSLDGATVKAGLHHGGRPADPDTTIWPARPEELEPARAFARNHLIGLGPEPVDTMVCMYTNTPDTHFAIGGLPGLPAVTVISACSGHGFKFGPVIGEIAADLVTEGGTPRRIDSFDLRRLLA